MPFKSQKQSALFHGVASGSIKGSSVPKSVAQKFVADSHGQNVKALPKRVKKAEGGQPNRPPLLGEQMGLPKKNFLGIDSRKYKAGGALKKSSRGR